MTQLLNELDGVASDNTDVFVLGATNQPWDVDVALCWPGRFDRTLLVTPPDKAARVAILRRGLEDRPVADVDVDAIAARTERYSGADLTLLCRTASDLSLEASAEARTHRPDQQRSPAAGRQAELETTSTWMETARNVAYFANQERRVRRPRGLPRTPSMTRPLVRAGRDADRAQAVGRGRRRCRSPAGHRTPTMDGRWCQRARRPHRGQSLRRGAGRRRPGGRHPGCGRAPAAPSRHRPAPTRAGRRMRARRRRAGGCAGPRVGRPTLSVLAQVPARYMRAAGGRGHRPDPW